jgi:hypothetical protein
MTKSAGVVKK